MVVVPVTMTRASREVVVKGCEIVGERSDGDIFARISLA
jgi:hypothetical protein